MPRKIRTLEERFWPKVDKDGPNGCWVWTGARTPFGYGVINACDGRNTLLYAHRLSHEWSSGAIPDGHFVCHRCDNPGCVNPDHLFAGTSGDNQRDHYSKYSETSSGCLLTPDSVREVRALYRSGGYTQHQIGAMFGVARATINTVISGRSWSWVSD